MSAQIQSVAIFGQLNTTMAVSTKENGSSSATLLTKKEYGERHGLKGAALNQAHYEYKRDAMQSNAKVIGAALLTGEIGITRIGANAKRDGGSLSFKAMSALKAPKAKADKVDLTKLTDDAILDEMIRRGITLAAE